MDSQLTSVNRKRTPAGQWLQVVILLLFVPTLIVLSWQGRTEVKPRAAEWAQPASVIETVPDESAALSPLMPVTQGAGGNIAVVGSRSNPFSMYTAEILRAEGLNGFSSEELATLTISRLENKDVVILGDLALDELQVNMFAQWVDQGGTLIAFHPSELLAPLLGLRPAEGTINDKYLVVHADHPATQGIVHTSIQFHGTANLHRLAGATALASLYETRVSATQYPAVTTRNIGNKGGKAIAFTYDLARSIVYTRQGNPAWAGQKRDGAIDPIRSDDLFFPDWLDFEKVAIPQADEQQRLLANLVQLSSLHRKPIPRLWYLPRQLKAAIVMTGDNHAANVTSYRFHQYMALGPNTTQDVADWKAIRATSYIYPDMPISNEQAVFFQEQGFEISLHTNTGCSNYTVSSLKRDFREELSQFASSYPGVAAPATNRSHCLNWSDWSSTPKVEQSHGIRLDATYYYWPESWMHNRPGVFTGSGFPMRFADIDGSMIDVYQVATQMTDETNMNYASFCQQLLDKALGPEGYYGVFCANMHTDHPRSEGAEAIIASALARDVPVISARQLLTWLDARNNTSYGPVSWKNNRLEFSYTAPAEANHLTMLLPWDAETGKIAAIYCDEQPLRFERETIKGIDYAVFEVATGRHLLRAEYSKEKTPAGNTVPNQQPVNTNDEATLYLDVRPNPAIGPFNLITASRNPDSISVKLFDADGKLIETIPSLPSTGILKMGGGWKTGSYSLEVSQGTRKKTIRLNKVK